ncbi:MAG: sigma 54-interacting transcriptional regulator [Gammaproteobacteria bacterium]|jgi:two-component system, NtrC family, response regulator AtoC
MSEKKERPSVDIQSMVESHKSPFLVIDRQYRIVAVNRLFASTFGVSQQEILGKTCYEVTHCNDEPCHVLGLDCPLQHVFNTGKPYTCTHEHAGNNDRRHKCRVDAFPLVGSNGDLYLGESIEELPGFTSDNSVEKRMVGESASFRDCLKKLDLASGADVAVLLEGETGVGKELAAQYIHEHSPRAGKPFQILDSTVLADGLFESEVFGHEKGSYTGSAGRKQGLFELAEGGTLFIDEIGDLPASQQSKLLRVLETGQFRRVGGNEILSADVRVVCATNRNLWDSVRAGGFRGDLYYRIACMTIQLPALRERLEDIPLICAALVRGIASSMEHPLHLSECALEPLQSYHYPGNIRELRNILQIAASHTTNFLIDAQTIQSVMETMPQYRHGRPRQTAAGSGDEMKPALHRPEAGTLPGSLSAIESEYLQNLLRCYSGNRKKIANILGVSERTVYRKLKKLNLN